MKFLPNDPVRRIKEQNLHESLTEEQYMEEGRVIPQRINDEFSVNIVIWKWNGCNYIRRNYTDEALTFYRISIA